MAAAPGPLLVIVPDRLSDLATKGEVTERYYNPGDLFDEVDLLLINDDRPDPEAIAPMFGRARFRIHNLPEDPGLFKRSLFWRPRLLRGWASAGMRLARERRPALIRCHGAHLNAFVASEIKRKLGIPYVVSLHINPDLDIRANVRRESGGGWRERLPLRAAVAIERTGVSNADCVVCVYRFSEPYARRCGARRVEVIYNVVCPGGVQPKLDYSLSGPARIIVPGRQIPPKDPMPVIEAISSIDGVELTLVGDGPLHGALRERAAERGIEERCRFLRSIPNDALCQTLRDYDVLVSVNDYGGVSKVELEAALVGMPTVTNRHPEEAEPEVLERNCVVVDGDAASYRQAIRRLLDEPALRERLGTQLRIMAQRVSPERMEAAYANLYRELTAA